MRIRRCAILFFEPREEVAFALAELLSGRGGVTRTLRWYALAPHLPAPVEISASERDLLGSLSPSQWTEHSALAEDVNLQALIGKGLVVQDIIPGQEGASTAVPAAAFDDARLRRVHWHPLAALLHAFTRWNGVDSVADARTAGIDTAAGLRERHGAPPPDRVLPDAAEVRDLPAALQTEFDALLHRRATCRNFDAARALPLSLFSTLLARTFGVQARVQRGGLVFDKKNSPSGGGLHPTSACLIVQNVEGIAPGLYRYLADSHQLVALPFDAAELPALALEAVSQQDWFANAHCLVVLVAAFERTFWKYRRHDKGYRVITLEAGHISQTLYLSATELGLGAFITGAINERPLERVFALDPLTEGALAICGFGWRGATMHAAELDPAGQVWTRAS